MVSDFHLWLKHGLLTKAAVTLTLALCFTSAVNAQPDTTTTASEDSAATATGWLADDEWRSLSREQRRERQRRDMVSRFVPHGTAPTVDDLDYYVEKFGAMTVYDPRYYLYKVKAQHVPGTTGSVQLTGEVYPAHYRHGVADTLEALGFNIAENSIATLPALQSGQQPYGVSTTSAATLRSEPRRRAEQVNSVAMGGWIRVLRSATDADVSTASSSSRRAPRADELSSDKPSDWILAQTMEGYLGYARKSDFAMQDDYRLPDGMLKFPVTLQDSATTLPAGVFVYGAPASGWHLHSGEKLPLQADVTDLRPQFTAEQIETLMQPFMETRYVWGGVTDEGVDCSGFSQYFMRTAGIMIPRDAVQQATSGFIVAWGDDVAEKALPGDLIFFVRETGRVNHVAISLGGSKIIHSSGHGVHIADLKDKMDEEDDGRILFARRIAVKN